MLAFYPRDAGSIPTHSTKGSEGCISGDRISILGVVRIPHKTVGPVAVPSPRQIGNVKIEGDWIQKENEGSYNMRKTVHKNLPYYP